MANMENLDNSMTGSDSYSTSTEILWKVIHSLNHTIREQNNEIIALATKTRELEDECEKMKIKLGIE